jgi:hypothetical protein
MWKCKYDKFPIYLILKIKSDKGIGGICFWNYNKSLIDNTIGIKEIEIIINGE